MIVRENAGLAALTAMFERAATEGRSAFMPYFPIGYPGFETSIDIIAEMAALDVDGFEVGIPFSDPLADGPTIQAATQIALENGTTVRRCLEAVRQLRERGVQQPMMMMGYANPLIAYGAERFVQDARVAGADGLIVPDLPPEEAHYFSDACARHEMALTFFLAPTSNEERVRLVSQRATGFIYVVSLVGVTGARTELPTHIAQFIQNIRRQTETPLVMGFGISTADHARMMDGLVDGFIVGSAVVHAAREGVMPVRELVKRIVQR